MIALRSLRWPDDRASLLALDTSFTTDHTFRLERTDYSAQLLEVTAEPPIHKSYSLAADIDLFPNHDWLQIAEHDHKVVGVAAMTIEAWNQRAVLRHLYVTSTARGIGVGCALVTAAIGVARDRQARCIWVETQTINYGAVQFYRKMDFAWCGLDTSLYDSTDNEVALFFSRELR